MLAGADAVPCAEAATHCAPRLLLAAIAADTSEDRIAVERSISAAADLPARVLRAEWAVVVHPNASSAWARVSSVAAHFRVPLKVLGPAPSPTPTTAGLLGRKLLLQLRFIPLLKQHPDLHAIWLIDRGVSLEEFNMADFLLKWRCSFPGGAPLISQPVIYEEARDYWSVAWAAWQGLAEGGALAVATNFVEHHTALLDTRFFIWAVDRLQLHEMGRRMYNAKSDWGLDTLWCLAAKEYKPQREACALLLHPIHLVGEAAKHSEHPPDMRLWRWLQKRFPKWYSYPFGQEARWVAADWARAATETVTSKSEAGAMASIPESAAAVAEAQGDGSWPSLNTRLCPLPAFSRANSSVVWTAFRTVHLPAAQAMLEESVVWRAQPGCAAAGSLGATSKQHRDAREQPAPYVSTDAAGSGSQTALLDEVELIHERLSRAVALEVTKARHDIQAAVARRAETDVVTHGGGAAQHAGRNPSHGGKQHSWWTPFQNLPVFWINADAAEQRRSSMLAQFEKLGHVVHTRVPAVGSADIAEMLGQPGSLLKGNVSFYVHHNASASIRDSPEAAGTDLAVTYSHAELGCVLSHLHALQAIARQPHVDVALILEDDMLLASAGSLGFSLNRLASYAPPDWQILQLHIVNPSMLLHFCHNVADPFVPWEWRHWSTGAYLIRREAAQLVLSKTGFPAQFSVDPLKVTADRFIYSAVATRVYTFTRPLFGILSTPSSIQPLVLQAASLDGPTQNLTRAILSGDVRCKPLRWNPVAASSIRSLNASDQLRLFPRET